jgi:hypothetical protein
MSPEYGWLIELPTKSIPIYWDGNGPASFTPDYMQAVRFSRSDDAQRVLDSIIDENDRKRAKVVEHAWSDD